MFHAPIEHRIARIKEKYGDTGDVKKMLERKNRNRKTYYKYYTDREWGAYQNYQINLDSGYLGEDVCVDIIVEAAKRCDSESQA